MTCTVGPLKFVANFPVATPAPAVPSCDFFNLGSSYLNVTLTTVHHLYTVRLTMLLTDV